MIDLFKDLYLGIYSHFRRYYFYYLTIFCLPLFYNKITYNFSWTVLPIWSLKFGLLYLLTSLVIVFIAFIAIIIQYYGTIQVNTRIRKWKNEVNRMLFYVIPTALGLCILIAFKYLWYEGEEMYAILWAHAKSRFLLYLVFVVAFMIWLDTDPSRNRLVIYFSKKNGRSMDDHLLEEQASSTSPDIEKVSQVVENTIKSMLLNNLHGRGDHHVKGLLKEAMHEFVVDHPVLQHKEEQLINSAPLKSMLKEAIQEVEEEQNDLKDVPLENLYTSCYSKSPTKLIPSLNDSKEVMFFHIFAIESHTKNAVVILTDGTCIESPKILDVLKKLELLNWMSKVNKVHYVNMMHISIASPLDGKFVRIQALTHASVHQKLDKKQVFKICALGNKVKDKNIVDFMKMRFELNKDGWNTFVPLR